MILLGNKIKIHEIAKKIGVSSKEALERAKSLGIEVSSHLSGVEDQEAKRIEDSFKGTNNQAQKGEEKAKKVKKEEPVIIRRQVILEDEEDKNKKTKKQEASRNKGVGVVERDKNKDYNIVYRNKPAKPLTVSELFGKKEEPKQEVMEEKTAEPKVVEAKPIEQKPAVAEEPKQETKKARESALCPAHILAYSRRIPHSCALVIKVCRRSCKWWLSN